jgi:glycosyltransferase involved in cell wall biosynthesis
MAKVLVMLHAWHLAWHSSSFCHDSLWPVMNDIAFLLKTFERPDVAQRCVNSILAMWPDAKIYQADDSRQPVAADGVHKFWSLPFDVGVSAGRNHLIRHTTEQFIVSVDDDYIFDNHTDIPRMKALLQAHDDLVLVGCKCRHIRPNKAGWTKYFAHVRLDKNGVLWAPHPDKQPDKWHVEDDGLRWSELDTVSNFWIAKRRLFDVMMWDERLKIGGEHADFFQRLQASNGGHMYDRLQEARNARGKHGPLNVTLNAGQMKVAFVPSFYVSHKKNRPAFYQRKRKRDNIYEHM